VRVYFVLVPLRINCVPPNLPLYFYLRIRENLEVELERRRANEEEVKKALEEKKRLETINEFLSSKVKLYDLMKERIGAQEGEKFDVKQKPEFQKHIKEFCASTRETISTICHFASKKKITQVEMEVPHAFDLSDCFEVWYKAFSTSKRLSFLFGSLEAGDCNVAKAIGDWKIRFSGACE
jgi:hypothetical protein